MKNCKVCNAVNNDEAKFCSQCGATFEQSDLQEEAVKEAEIQPQGDVVQEEAVPQSEQNVSAETAVSEFQTEENSNSDAQSYTQIDLNGVSEAEFSAFVGKNQNDFMKVNILLEEFMNNNAKEIYQSLIGRKVMN